MSNRYYFVSVELIIYLPPPRIRIFDRKTFSQALFRKRLGNLWANSGELRYGNEAEVNFLRRTNPFRLLGLIGKRIKVWRYDRS